MCKSCKTSYNVLSHSHWGLRAGSIFLGGGGGGSLKFWGVVKKRQSPDFRSPEVGISAIDLKSHLIAQFEENRIIRQKMRNSSKVNNEF